MTQQKFEEKIGIGFTKLIPTDEYFDDSFESRCDFTISFSLASIDLDLDYQSLLPG